MLYDRQPDHFEYSSTLEETQYRIQKTLGRSFFETISVLFFSAHHDRALFIVSVVRHLRRARSAGPPGCAQLRSIS